MSDDQRFRRARALFDRLVDLPMAERARLLDAECGPGDADLRREVEDLLARDARTDNLPVPPVMDRLHPQEPEEAIGPYRIVGRLGEGGFGEVFVAEQSRPIRRRVALKVMRAGMDTKALLARFDAERQALALMDHPGIAKVLDAGETPRGRSFFVMELVKGESITSYCDRHRLALRERLELFQRVCLAVQHAHQKGIIHRDLKPSNVLVADGDDGPVPKVIDFGIAKATSLSLTEKTLYTEQGQLIGTPEYMSPEQAEMGGLDVDTRTDIYSLGVVLYELLTGTLPFDPGRLREAGISGIQEIIRKKEPPRPSTRITKHENASIVVAKQRRTDPEHLRRQIRGDLDWIVLRAMEKDRNRRYESASALAMEIDRYLNVEPVLAGPPSLVYKAGKFAKRHRTVLAMSLLVLASILYFAVESRRARVVAESALGDAEKARDESEAVTAFLSDMLGAVDPRAEGKDVTVRQILDEGAEMVREEFSGQPLVRARLMSTMGNVYRELGHYAPAESLLTDALAAREAALGARHPDVGSSLNDLGVLLAETGEYEEARALYERAVEIQQSALAPGDPELLESLNNLGNLLKDTGDYEEARKIHERVLDAREEAMGPDDISLVGSLNNLANVLGHLGDIEGSIAMHERALAIRERELGPNHIDVASSLNNLGGALYRKGDVAAARPLWERALAIREKALGPDHPEVAEAANNLAVANEILGEFDRARAYYERALAIAEKAFGPDHPRRASTLDGMGSLLTKMGDFAAARSLHEQALEIWEKAHGPDHPGTAVLLNNLGLALQNMGDLEAARSCYERSLAIREKAYGPDHYRVATALKSVAGVLRATDDDAAARPLLERALAIDEKVFGPDHATVAGDLEALASLLRDLGEVEPARTLEQRAAMIERSDSAHP